MQWLTTLKFVIVDKSWPRIYPNDLLVWEGSPGPSNWMRFWELSNSDASKTLIELWFFEWIVTELPLSKKSAIGTIFPIRWAFEWYDSAETKILTCLTPNIFKRFTKCQDSIS